MKSKAYYNENDPKAAAWLRELIKAGLIARGEVDERSIKEVTPKDLKGFTQHHFFAGIGGWSYALRLAGWADRREVWTGSCPCQPFSEAGKQEGTADARHLWPDWFRLIRKHRPVAVFGEQVAAAIRHGWLDLVQADMESIDYALGSAVMGAHSVGAPHVRQRLLFVADPTYAHRRSRERSAQEGTRKDESRRRGSASRAAACSMAITLHTERRPLGVGQQNGRDRQDNRRAETRSKSGARGKIHQLAFGVAQGDAEQQGLEGLGRYVDHGNEPGRIKAYAAGSVTTPGPVNGAWKNAEWLYCTDGKYRPVEPGSFPLAHGVLGRVGLLRGYGNAIVSEATAAFIRAYKEVIRK